MKISAISTYNYSQKPYAVKNQMSDSALTNIKNQAPAFKGKGWATFGIIGGAIFGSLLGGPMGAAAAAAIFGSIGSGMNDKDGTDETSGYPSDQMRATNY